MRIVRPIGLRLRSLASVAAAGVVLAPLGGCATGSSASFTQAPLIFAEQAPTDGPPTAASIGTAAASPLAGGPASLGYVAIGGNAVLPVAAVAALTSSVDASLASTLSRLPVPLSASLQASPAGGAQVAAGLPAASLAASASVMPGQTLPAVTAAVAAPLPATTAAITAGESTGLPGATAVAAVGPVALVTSQPILTGAAAQPVTPAGSNLLTLSAGNLARICLLKGCR